MDFISQSAKRPNVEVLNSLPEKSKKSCADSIPSNNSYPSAYPGQSIFTHPILAGNLKEYRNVDTGPFIVHITKVGDSTVTIRPMQIGQMLSKNAVKGIIRGGVKKVGRNRISVEFADYLSANVFLKSEFLGNNGFSAEIPTYNFCRMGLVRGIPTDLSMAEFAESIEVPTGCGIVLKARRLNRKDRSNGSTSWIPTNSVVLTFQGQRLPDNIYSFHSSIVVQKYQLPTIQCLKCCRFGHVLAQCHSKIPRCYRCAGPHLGATCSSAPDEEHATCLFCSGRHYATNKCCQEHIRQRNIKSVMSDESISYQEASIRFPLPRRSYADVTGEPSLSYIQNPQASYNDVASSSPVSSSYRKTVMRSPRPRSPLGQGYDHVSHQNIIRNPSSSARNGIALNSDSSPFANLTPQNSAPSISISSNENFLDIICELLFNLLSKYSDALPSNVANSLRKVMSLIPSSNGSHSPSPMEL